MSVRALAIQALLWIGASGRRWVVIIKSSGPYQRCGKPEKGLEGPHSSIRGKLCSGAGPVVGSQASGSLS
jgi:hypothetical protein